MGSLASPHVVMVPIDVAGHFTPFLMFAKRLASEGFTITLVISDKHVSELGTRQLVPQELPIRILGLKDGSKHRSHVEVFQERKTQAGRDRAIKLLVELMTDVSSPNAQELRGVPTAAVPICVLHDMMACWAQEAAAKLGIEKHLLYVSPVCCLSIGLQV